MTEIDWISLKKEITEFARKGDKTSKLKIKIPNCAKNGNKLTTIMWPLKNRDNDYTFHICTAWYKGNPEKKNSGYVAFFIKEPELSNELAEA